MPKKKDEMKDFLFLNYLDGDPNQKVFCEFCESDDKKFCGNPLELLLHITDHHVLCISPQKKKKNKNKDPAKYACLKAVYDRLICCIDCKQQFPSKKALNEHLKEQKWIEQLSLKYNKEIVPFCKERKVNTFCSVSRFNTAERLLDHIRATHLEPAQDNEADAAKEVKHMETQNVGLFNCTRCGLELTAKEEAMHKTVCFEEKNETSVDKVGESDQKPVKITCPECLLEFDGFAMFKTHFFSSHESSCEKEDVVDQENEEMEMESNENLDEDGMSDSFEEEAERESKLDDDEPDVDRIIRKIRARGSTRCPILRCSKTFDSPEMLEGHYNLFHAHKMRRGGYYCDICSMKFVGKANKKHLDANPKCKTLFYTKEVTQYSRLCEYCGLVFSSLNWTVNHIESVHEKKVMKCKHCDKTFASRNLFNSHEKNAHKTKDNPYECKECHKVFPHGISLRQHMFTHTRKSKHYCKVCDHYFVAKVFLAQHLDSKHPHLDEELKNCRICDHLATEEGVDHSNCIKEAKESFKSSYKTAPKRYHKSSVCLGCSKVFFSHQVMNAHFRAVHLGELPYQCDICGAKFGYASNMRSHMKVHMRKSQK